MVVPVIELELGLVIMPVVSMVSVVSVSKSFTTISVISVSNGLSVIPIASIVPIIPLPTIIPIIFFLMILLTSISQSRIMTMKNHHNPDLIPNHPRPNSHISKISTHNIFSMPAIGDPIIDDQIFDGIKGMITTFVFEITTDILAPFRRAGFY